MPIHDWTRVTAGTWHDFHLAWVAKLSSALNNGVLPNNYYAQAEIIVGAVGPDYSAPPTAIEPDFVVDSASPTFGSPLMSVETSPPRPRLIAEAEMDDYVLKRRTIVIRHTSGDRIVALLGIASPGNKSARNALRSFVEKAVEASYRGYHLLIVDLFPPGPRDPQGIHAAIWNEFADDEFALPPGQRLTLAAYSAGPKKRAYVETTAVGNVLIEMPLFLEPEWYVNVPLEATYAAAYRGVPRRWRVVLDAPAWGSA